ncbi:HicB family toxin-antitoxin system [Cellulomonas sp. HD19AZ1]|uniref:HicB family toxin-antitoxin system n=1 Tax=Cellulomonas sp. HD19AZ1 TaxID=2559593 RepID=UPI0010709207|nr:HicB family toxin-antitoxin system [Cellulomonas sp. HD19AZ1]TFH70619.1 HicB family toxin-antitoxin system [Cellulomonas sp. HD19AZ1]
MSTTYTATAAREGRWWTITVPDVGVTQSRRLDDVEGMARELVAVTLDVPLSDGTVTVEVAKVGDVDVADRLATLRRERAEAERLEAAAREHTAALARDLVARDVPLRDVGAILGVSHLRAHQLVAG